MNWITTEAYSSARSYDSYCEHFGKAPMHIVSREHDSWGSESSAFCKECWTAIKVEEGEATEPCSDCHKVFKVAELRRWTWYDFYPPQGDEPLMLCEACLNAPEHRKRVKDDNRDRREELRDYEIYDDEPTWEECLSELFARAAVELSETRKSRGSRRRRPALAIISEIIKIGELTSFNVNLIKLGMKPVEYNSGRRSHKSRRLARTIH